MSKYIISRIFFITVLIIAGLFDWKYGLPFFVYVIIALGYAAVTFYGSYFIQSDFFIRSLCRGNENKKIIAITFDDGPLADFTTLILDVLKEHKVSSLFFLIGKNIAGREAIIERMGEEGHIIGNHSYSHNFWFSLKKGSAMLSDLKKCDEEIFKIIGKKPRLFRPPYGVTNPMVRQAIVEGGYQSIGWSLRTYDTTSKSAEQLVNKTVKDLQNGDVILFHDWGKYTGATLAIIIQEIRKQGFDIVRADELLEMQAYY